MQSTNDDARHGAIPKRLEGRKHIPGDGSEDEPEKPDDDPRKLEDVLSKIGKDKRVMFLVSNIESAPLTSMARSHIEKFTVPILVPKECPVHEISSTSNPFSEELQRISASLNYSNLNSTSLYIIHAKIAYVRRLIQNSNLNILDFKETQTKPEEPNFYQIDENLAAGQFQEAIDADAEKRKFDDYCLQDWFAYVPDGSEIPMAEIRRLSHVDALDIEEAKRLSPSNLFFPKLVPCHKAYDYLLNVAGFLACLSENSCSWIDHLKDVDNVVESVEQLSWLGGYLRFAVIRIYDSEQLYHVLIVAPVKIYYEVEQEMGQYVVVGSGLMYNDSSSKTLVIFDYVRYDDRVSFQTYSAMQLVSYLRRFYHIAILKATN